MEIRLPCRVHEGRDQSDNWQRQCNRIKRRKPLNETGMRVFAPKRGGAFLADCGLSHVYSYEGCSGRRGVVARS